jgi:quercetin dioxygenase-like cupin family protein
MKYTRVYADAMGETHYDEVEVAVAPADVAPPTPPVYLSTLHPAMQYAFCRFPAGWVGPWHPTPRRQWFCILSGEMEAQVSDGEVRRFGAGSVVLFEDTAGKGHLSRAVGPTEAWTVVVQLPAERPGAEGTSEAGAP